MNMCIDVQIYYSKEEQFVYISLHKQMVLTFNLEDSVAGEIKNRGEQDKLPIGTIYSKNPPHGYPFPPPHFKEAGSSTYPKLMEMGARGLKIFDRKEGIKAK